MCVRESSCVLGGEREGGNEMGEQKGKQELHSNKYDAIK